MKKLRLHVFVNGRDYYSKFNDPLTECGPNIKTYKDFCNYFSENLLGKIDKFIMELEDGNMLMLNSQSAQNMNIVVEQVGE